MSAECHIHGTDLLYTGDDWQAPSYCPSCEVDELRARAEAAEAAAQRAEAVAEREVKGRTPLGMTETALYDPRMTKASWAVTGCIILLALVLSVDTRGGIPIEPASSSPSRASTEAMSLAVVRPAVELVADGQDAGLPAELRAPTTATAPADVAQLEEQPRRNGQVESSSPSVSSITYDGHLSYADFDAVLTAADWPTDPGIRAVAYSIACGNGITTFGESACYPRVDNGISYGLFGIHLATWGPVCGLSADDLRDPVLNAGCALRAQQEAVREGYGRFQPWGR